MSKLIVARGLRHEGGSLWIRGWLWAMALLACTLGAMPGVAQTPPPAQADTSAVLQEVVVTGSRIAAPNQVSTSPIQVVTAKSIATTGKTDISDLIMQLPQNFNNGIGQDLGNGTSGLTTAGGVATADLRGLGPNRTLVLVDGRRLGIGSPYTAIQAAAPDLDQIPAGLIDRVDVVTGGASATYGSDAIAGVINFILKRNFEGIQVDGQWNVNWHDNHSSEAQSLASKFGLSPPTGSVHDGRQKNFDVLMGTNFADNKGNITAYMSYRQADPVRSSERDFGACQINPILDAGGNAVGLHCHGSINSNWFEPITGPNAGTTYSVSGNGFIPFGSAPTTPPAVFNSQPYIFMTRQDERYNAAVLAHEDLFDSLKPYGEFYFMDDRTHQEPAPSALFLDSNPNDPFGSGNYPVNCDNPFLSGAQASIMCSPAQLAYVAANPGQPCAYSTDPVTHAVTSPNCVDMRIGRRNIEGGARQSDYQHINYRAVFGSKGDFADAWSYDAYGQYYYTSFNTSNQRYLSFRGIDNALSVTGTRANPTCIGNPAGCIPYNIFADGGVTPAQVQSLYELGTATGSSTLRTLHAEVTGQLGKYGVTSPWATDGVAVNVGFEHRNEHQFFQPDAAELSGDLSGFGAAAVPIDNSISVKEEFAELRVPLVQHSPWAHELLFDTGYRRSDYSTTGVTNTYKFELQYAPIADYRLRASYDKAVRAPNIIELYNPQVVVTLGLGYDPCAPTLDANNQPVHAQYTLEQCERMGATAAQYGNGYGIPQGAASQLSGLQGGNTHLKPETAETYTIGLNFAPSQIPHFTGSIDYYHIALKDQINTIPASAIFQGCGVNNDPFYCSQIFRNPVTGGLNTVGPVSGGGYVIQTDVNTGALLMSGLDLQLAYRHDLPAGWGAMAFEMNGAYLQHFEQTPIPGGHTFDCAGYFGITCQTQESRWRHIARATWETPWGVDASATWRYIGPVSDDNNAPDPTLRFANPNYGGGYDFVNARIPAYSYLDLSGEWHANKILSFRAGINNVLDKDPPLLNVGLSVPGQANTIDVYDMFGRQIFVAFSAKY
ncbi:MAG: TonB-dependent receptor [Proteobacteria bacterium]|nr:TonB-dependent receptor [Pseudomonadota bacterium]